MKSNTSKNRLRQHWYSLGLTREIQIPAWISIITVFVLSFLDLAGWMFNITLFKSVIPQWIPMKIITAVCFIFAATSLLIIQLKIPSILKKLLARVFAVLICLAGLITLYLYFYPVKTGNETLLTGVSYLSFFLIPVSGMAFFTATNFFLLGCIILLLSAGNTNASNIAHVLIIPIILVSYYVIISYVLGVYSSTEMLEVPVGLNTCIAFLGIGVAVLLIRPETWLLKAFLSEDTGGIFARKLLPGLMIMPLIIGWLRIRGERTYLFNSGEGVVLVAVTYTICFLILVLLTARSVNKADQKRRLLEEALRRSEVVLKESEQKLWSVLNATQESIYMFDRNGIITMSNSTGLERLKRNAENELIGHHFSEFIPQSTTRIRQVKLDEVFSFGKPLEFEDEREGRMYSHNFFPVFKDDKVTSIVTYSTDITERKRAEANLKESEDRFRTIAESLPVLISIYSIKDSTISFVNESFENTFGFKKDELTNRKLPDSFFNPEDRKDLGNLLKENGKAYNKEIRVKKADGTPFWIMTSIRKILFMNNPAYLTASINITETIKAQEELIRLNRTLDAHSKSSHAMMHSKNEFSYLHEVCKIIIEDCGHTMIWVGYAQNDKHKSVKPVAYYGFDKGYIEQLKVTWDDTERGRGPTGIAIKTGKPAMCKNMLTDPEFKPWREAAIKRGYASSLVLPLILDGKPFAAITIYSKEPDPFSESEIDLLSDLADDMAYGISYIRLEESERSAAKVIKENEVKLKELIDTKDKFFNIVAHDLKNPFTSLIGSSELLFENIHHLNTKSIQDLALILNDSAKSGYAILQNLLDWSRSQTGLLKINSERVNLRILINENISNLQLPAANKEIKMSNLVTEDIFIFADKNMINTILRNILSNALKFTYKNGKVIVSTILTNDDVIISVKDDGIGIPRDKIESLFRIEVNNSMPGTENEQGTGLGLKLSKEFVEKLGGRIWVESNVGYGSDFKFTIPVNDV
jgi:PAS domain S-box-containing protein